MREFLERVSFGIAGAALMLAVCVYASGDPKAGLSGGPGSGVYAEIPKPALTFAPIQPTAFVFYNGQSEILRFEPDGKIFVRGRQTEEDAEVVAAVRAFFLGRCR